MAERATGAVAQAGKRRARHHQICAPRPASVPPARLYDARGEVWDGVLRAKGVVWLANEHDVTGSSCQAGYCIELEPMAYCYAAGPPSRVAGRSGAVGLPPPELGRAAGRPDTGARLSWDPPGSGVHSGGSGTMSVDRRGAGPRAGGPALVDEESVGPKAASELESTGAA